MIIYTASGPQLLPRVIDILAPLPKDNRGSWSDRYRTPQLLGSAIMTRLSLASLALSLLLYSAIPPTSGCTPRLASLNTGLCPFDIHIDLSPMHYDTIPSLWAIARSDRPAGSIG